MSQARDLPPVSSSIIWAKQIDRQLTMYLNRVEAVLGEPLLGLRNHKINFRLDFYIYFRIHCSGKGWENHIEGQKLKADGDSFRLKLNTQEIFDEWAKSVQQKNLGVSGRIFTVESTRSRAGRGNVMKLKVGSVTYFFQMILICFHLSSGNIFLGKFSS